MTKAGIVEAMYQPTYLPTYLVLTYSPTYPLTCEKVTEERNDGCGAGAGRARLLCVRGEVRGACGGAVAGGAVP